MSGGVVFSRGSSIASITIMAVYGSGSAGQTGVQCGSEPRGEAMRRFKFIAILGSAVALREEAVCLACPKASLPRRPQTGARR